ncbi:MAG: hypothetical protein KA712_18740 [Myxococcales bacterium]|nr:hypothetical protein [Myxococcales bacterium]
MITTLHALVALVVALASCLGVFAPNEGAFRPTGTVGTSSPPASSPAERTEPEPAEAPAPESGEPGEGPGTEAARLAKAPGSGKRPASVLVRAGAGVPLARAPHVFAGLTVPRSQPAHIAYQRFLS